MPDVEVAGEVVWREDDEFGVEFHQHISDGLIAHFLGSAPHGGLPESELRDKFGRRLPPLAGEVRIKPI